MNVGFEGPRLTGRTTLREGDTAFVVARLVRAPVAEELPRGVRAGQRDVGVLARVALARRLPRPPVAVAPRAQRADAEGPPVRADRRVRRRADDVAAARAGRPAQLGLPLLVRARLVVHPARRLLARLRLGGRRLPLLPVRPRRRRRGGELQNIYSVSGERELPETKLDHLSGYLGARPVRIGNDAHCGRAARRLGRDRRRRLHPCEDARQAAGARLAAREEAGRAGRRALAQARPRHLGAARRAAALRLVEGHVLGRARPRRGAGRAARRARPRRAVARDRAGDQARRARAGPRRARRVHPALRHDRARRVGAADPARPLPAADRPPRAQDRAGDPGRAGRGRARAAPPPRRPRTSRSRARRSRSARSGWSPRSTRSARRTRRASCASGCWPTRRASACTPSTSTRTPAATWATSRTRSRTWRSSTRSST